MGTVSLLVDTVNKCNSWFLSCILFLCFVFDLVFVFRKRISSKKKEEGAVIEEEENEEEEEKGDEAAGRRGEETPPPRYTHTSPV